MPIAETLIERDCLTPVGFVAKLQPFFLIKIGGDHFAKQCDLHGRVTPARHLERMILCPIIMVMTAKLKMS